MKADALPLPRLYDTLNKAYVVPSYQRPFAWDPQRTLDLLQAVLEDAEGGAKLTSLGTLLFCEVPVGGGNHPFGNNAPDSNAPNTVWEVVDGQQRLTVLAIIGYALKKQLETLSKVGYQFSPALELELMFLTSRRRAGKNVPLLIRDEDNYDSGYRSDLAHMLNSFAGNEPYPPQVGERLLSTLSKVSEWIHNNLDQSKFGLFCDHLLNKCQIVQVLADDQDVAFSMFEPLNSTSEPLTAFEVYRSKVVRKIQPVPEFPQTLGLLDYDNTKRDDVIKRSNTLIFTMSQVYGVERLRVHFVPLKKYLDGNISAGFVSRFEIGAEFFRTVWLDQSLQEAWFDDETKNCVRFLKASQHDAAVPVLLRYFQTDRSKVPQVAKIIVAFYALWRPAFPTNKLPDIYRALLRSGGADDMSLGGGKLKSPKELASYFRGRLENRLGNIVPPNTFEALWVADKQQLYLDYEQLRTICRLFIFIDIGASIKSNLVPDDPWTVLDDIEHIIPAGVQPTVSNVHRIGNLTFLPGAVNKSIQAATWVDKKEIYGLLASPNRPNPPPTQFADGRQLPPGVREYLGKPNSPMLAHLGELAAISTWDEDVIRTRTEAMLRTVWQILYEKWLNP